METRLEPTIERAIYDQIPLKACRHDGTELPCIIMASDTIDGWKVPGLTEQQWLTIECPTCHFCYSLWKLGYGRSNAETEDMKERIKVWQGHVLIARKETANHKMAEHLEGKHHIKMITQKGYPDIQKPNDIMVFDYDDRDSDDLGVINVPILPNGYQCPMCDYQSLWQPDSPKRGG